MNILVLGIVDPARRSKPGSRSNKDRDPEKNGLTIMRFMFDLSCWIAIRFFFGSRSDPKIAIRNNFGSRSRSDRELQHYSVLEKKNGNDNASKTKEALQLNEKKFIEFAFLFLHITKP